LWAGRAATGLVSDRTTEVLRQGTANQANWTGTEGNIAAIEFLTSFRAISLAKN